MLINVCVCVYVCVCVCVCVCVICLLIYDERHMYTYVWEIVLINCTHTESLYLHTIHISKAAPSIRVALQNISVANGLPEASPDWNVIAVDYRRESYVITTLTSYLLLKC